MNRQETAVEVCVRFAPELASAVWRDKPSGGFKWRGEAEGLVINVTTRELEERLDPDVPKAVRKLRDSFIEVYKYAVGICHELGRSTLIMPQQVADVMNATFKAANVKRYASLHTIGHAFQALEEVGAVKGAARFGWLVVMFPPDKQPELDFGDESLPSLERQTPRACSVPQISNASRTARERDGRPAWEPAMFGKQIWVTGEKCDWTGGLIVEDANGNTHLLEGKQERVRYEGRSGRVATPPAVKCELVNVEDDGRHQVATVKVRAADGRKVIRVRVLGDWQLEGRMSDREQLAEVASRN